METPPATPLTAALGTSSTSTGLPVGQAGEDSASLSTPISFPENSTDIQSSAPLRSTSRPSVAAFIASLVACCLFGGGAIYLLLFAPSGLLTLGGGLVLLVVFFLLLRPLLRGAAHGVLEELDDSDPMLLAASDPNWHEDEDDEENDNNQGIGLATNSAVRAATAVVELDAHLGAVGETTPAGEVSPRQAKMLIEEIKNVDQALLSQTGETVMEVGPETATPQAGGENLTNKK